MDAAHPTPVQMRTHFGLCVKTLIVVETKTKNRVVLRKTGVIEITNYDLEMNTMKRCWFENVQIAAVCESAS